MELKWGSSYLYVLFFPYQNILLYYKKTLTLFKNRIIFIYLRIKYILSF